MLQRSLRMVSISTSESGIFPRVYLVRIEIRHAELPLLPPVDGHRDSLSRAIGAFEAEGRPMILRVC